METQTPNQTPTIVPPVKPAGVLIAQPHHHISRWVAFAIIIVVAAVVGCWAWKQNKQTLDTNSPSTSLGTTGEYAGWQTYRNEEYGFEVKYPNSLELMNRSLLGKNGSVAFGVSEQTASPENAEQIAVGSRAWHKFDMGDADCGGPVFQTDFNGKTLDTAFISCNGNEPVLISENDQLIRQILSTFKFIE